MNQTNQMSEDMYEKARGAFFGTVKTQQSPSASSVAVAEQRNETSPKEVAVLVSDMYNAT